MNVPYDYCSIVRMAAPCVPRCDIPALPSFTMAFQPIINLPQSRIWGYEALVRGKKGESADLVFSKIRKPNMYQFDQACRYRAVELAGDIFPKDEDLHLSINIMPGALGNPAACIHAFAEKATAAGLKNQRIMFEFTENDRVKDVQGMADFVAEFRRKGFLTALDDFGAGQSGLCRLAEFQTEFIKIDMDLTRAINADPVRRAIVSGIVNIANALDIEIIAEGVETSDEILALSDMGIELFQGFYFAKPQMETLPVVSIWNSTVRDLTYA